MNSGITAADEVDAGRDHRGRVDQGADRRRAFHRVGQPDVQRELRRLADAAEEDAQAGGDQHPVGHGAVLRPASGSAYADRRRRRRSLGAVRSGMSPAIAREQQRPASPARRWLSRLLTLGPRAAVGCRRRSAADDLARQPGATAVRVRQRRRESRWKISSKLNVPT